MDQFETAAQSAGAADSLSEAPRNQVLQALGERVRSLRSRRGMTRRALAAAADVRSATWPTSNTARAMCRCWSCTILHRPCNAPWPSCWAT